MPDEPPDDSPARIERRSPDAGDRRLADIPDQSMRLLVDAAEAAERIRGDAADVMADANRRAEEILQAADALRTEAEEQAAAFRERSGDAAVAVEPEVSEDTAVPLVGSRGRYTPPASSPTPLPAPEDTTAGVPPRRRLGLGMLGRRRRGPRPG